ncbi:MAG TPA: sigma-70 family RNA polymerase sigma factor [Solirubrobacter sp.]
MGGELDFEQLYALHAGAVRGYAMRRCDPETADDVVADVFLVAWRRRAELPEEALPWLLGIARRVLANHARGQSRRVRLQDRLAAQPAASGAPTPAEDKASARLNAALARLSERDRELLLLMAWEGLELRQAAEVLGVRPNTLAVRFHRARRRLSAALEAVEADDGSERAPIVHVEVSR